MGPDNADTLLYQRSLFVTRLPVARLYTPAHYWLYEQKGTWRVGLTQFGTRRLGEIVDYGFDVRSGAPIAGGQVLGWIEGFKAVSDLLGVVGGRFCTSNPQLARDPEAIDRDCYGEGWLYEASGQPDPQGMDVRRYQAFLDETIDQLIAKQQSQQ